MQPVADPFASGRVVEGDRIRSIPVGAPLAAPEGTGFVDGIQRWVVDGHFGLVPVVRGYVDAAVLERKGMVLRQAARRGEEFIVVPAHRLTRQQRDSLEATGLTVHESEAGERAHPVVDRYAAAQVVEERREVVERAVASEFLRLRATAWLVVDGAIGTLAHRPGGERLIGLIKSHETQFLDGDDLHTALTLEAGFRSSVFERTRRGCQPVFCWYLRLWPWPEQDLLYGLTRVERSPSAASVQEATEVSRWLLGERTPISAPDARWDRLIYPIHEVETYLNAHAGGWL
jgi:hypothetical protein